jgi:hypothetical protein
MKERADNSAPRMMVHCIWEQITDDLASVSFQPFSVTLVSCVEQTPVISPSLRAGILGNRENAPQVDVKSRASLKVMSGPGLSSVSQERQQMRFAIVGGVRGERVWLLGPEEDREGGSQRFNKCGNQEREMLNGDRVSKELTGEDQREWRRKGRKEVGRRRGGGR